MEKKGVGEGAVNWGVGGPWGSGDRGTIGLIALRRPPRPVGGRGIPKACCLERRGSVGAALVTFWDL